MIQLNLVIFDCDGVLIDSEILADRVILQYCAECFPELDFSPWQRQMTGVMNREILRGMETDYGICFPADAEQAVLARLDTVLHREVQAIGGVAAALAALDGRRKAVASNSHHQHVRRMLHHTGLESYFNGSIFGADLVSRPKPHPDLYRFVAEQMGVTSTRCVVVEDSVTGATAALAAGMEVIGFTGGSHIQPGHDEVLRSVGVGHIIGKMDELPVLLQSLEDRDV